MTSTSEIRLLPVTNYPVQRLDQFNSKNMRKKQLIESRNLEDESRHRSNTRSSIDKVVKFGFHKLRKGEIQRYCEFGLENKLVLQYIHEIYGQYNIPDPLETGTTSLENTTFSRSGRKSLDFSKQSDTRTRIDRLKKSLRQQLDRTASESEQGLSRMQKFLQTNTSVKVSRYENEIPDATCFRFCLVCEEMIGDNNLILHEKQCTGFELLYKMPVQDVIQYIKAKNERCEQSILETLKLREEFREQPILQFLRQINEKRLGDIELYYSKAVQSLPVKSMKILELCYKLKWFRKVLQQFETKTQFY